jgi:transcriptional regulator with XRE-family HTH domain
MANAAKKTLDAEFQPMPMRLVMTPAAMVRNIREAQELTQAGLAGLTGIAQPTISAIEAGRVSLGVERAARLARALCVHPAVLLFPQWDVEAESATVRRKR